MKVLAIRNAIAALGAAGALGTGVYLTQDAPSESIPCVWEGGMLTQGDGGCARLDPTSPFVGKATDGKDIGVDVDALHAAICTEEAVLTGVMGNCPPPVWQEGAPRP